MADCLRLFPWTALDCVGLLWTILGYPRLKFDLLLSFTQLAPLLTEDRKLRIAQMIADGISKNIIADREGVSRSTIFNWAKNPELAAKIKEIETQTIKQAQKIIQNRQSDRATELSEQIQEYGDRRRKAAIALQKSAFKILQRLNERIESLNPLDVPIKDLSGLYRSVVDMIDKGSTAEAEALGVEQMMRIIEEKKQSDL